MNKLFTILILIITLASCSPKLQPGTNTVTVVKDSIVLRDTIVYRDTTIVVPGETVTIHETVDCPDAVFNKTVTSASGNTTAKVNLSHGVLNIDCGADSLKLVIKNLKTYINSLEKYKTIATTTTTVLPPKRFIPKWVWWLLGINILYILIRIALAYFKLPIRL